MSEQAILNTLLENIQTKVSPQVFTSYFAELQILSIEDDRVTIACKNIFTKQTIENRFFNTLLNTIRNVLSKNNIELELAIKSIRTPTSLANNSNLFSSTPNQSNTTIVTPVYQQPKYNTPETFLNSKYTFDSFIPGSHNQLAHAAAIAISNNPGTAYNPFFIYGGVGLGKTHLMQAIGNHVLQVNSSAKVLYCTTEIFLNEMVQGIRTQKTLAFREKYRALDILILDDIQFLSNKEALQEEFFNTFNTLYQAGKQIIIASDRPPHEISHLEDRIRSRFEGGLVADIKVPNSETRTAILQKKLIDRNEFLPESIITCIAETIDTNIRELEGGLLKILIYNSTTGNLTVADVKRLLGHKIFARSKKINPLDIMKCVCDELSVELKDVKSTKRNYDISLARQICMYLLKDMLKLQLIKIAKHVGRKDHTTVMHGISKIEKLIDKDEETSRLIQELRAKIQQ